jgi:hypothetical protein
MVSDIPRDISGVRVIASDDRGSVTNTHTVVADVRNDVIIANGVISDVHHSVEDANVILSEPRCNVNALDAHTDVTDIDRTGVKSLEGNEDKDRSVSIRHTPYVVG